MNIFKCINLLFFILLCTSCVNTNYNKALTEFNNKKNPKRYENSYKILHNIDINSAEYKLNRDKIDKFKDQIVEQYKKDFKATIVEKYKSTWIVYEKNNVLYVSNFEMSKTKKLFGNKNLKAKNPKWSPDGKYIAFEKIKNSYTEIHIATPNGKKVEKITTKNIFSEEGQFNWSPDSKNIVLSTSMEIYKINIKTKKHKKLFPAYEGQNVFRAEDSDLNDITKAILHDRKVECGWPVLLKNNKDIVFFWNGGPYLLEENKKNQALLFDDMYQLEKNISKRKFRLENCTISNSGKYLAVDGVYIVDLENKVVKNTSIGDESSWSHDEENLLVSAYSDELSDIGLFIIPREKNSVLGNISFLLVSANSGSWSPPIKNLKF